MLCAITTIDNPYDPIDDFTSWFTFDVLNQHNTCERLARVANVTDMLSENEQKIEIERAIDEIIETDPENKYRKIKRAG